MHIGELKYLQVGTYIRDMTRNLVEEDEKTCGAKRGVLHRDRRTVIKPYRSKAVLALAGAAVSRKRK